MKTFSLSLIPTLALACTSTSNTSNPASTPPMPAVTTNRYDNARTGWDASETVLNTTNVASGAFGFLFSRATQGWIHSQPLYYAGVTVKNVKRNVVYVVTERNMVYAFDADDAAATEPLWSRQLAPTMPLSGVMGEYPGCKDILDEVGIASTPAISAETKRLYLVSKTKDAGQRLHALDLATGDDVAGSPATITAPGFDPNIHLSRAGLLVANGAVLVTFASQCDTGDYHGWAMTYDASTLKQLAVFNTTPNPPADMVKAQGGIWQSGAGPSVDDKGYLVVVGNGDSSGNNVGMSVIRLKPSDLTVTARFTPDDAVMINMRDKDLSTAALPVANSQIVAANKLADIYLLNQDDLKLVQKIQIPPVPPLMGSNEIHSFGYWNGAAGPLLYVWPDKSPLTAFKVEAGKLTEVAKSTILAMAAAGGHPGGLFVISSDGSKPGTGILWAIVPMVGDAWHDAAAAKLFAFDAADVSKPPLWSSPDKAEGDNADDYAGVLAKWAPPVVANGKLYLATGGAAGKLMVYGLKK
jgi:hypothetical protein